MTAQNLTFKVRVSLQFVRETQEKPLLLRNRTLPITSSVVPRDRSKFNIQSFMQLFDHFMQTVSQLSGYIISCLTGTLFDVRRANKALIIPYMYLRQEKHLGGFLVDFVYPKRLTLHKRIVFLMRVYLNEIGN